MWNVEEMSSNFFLKLEQDTKVKWLLEQDIKVKWLLEQDIKVK